VTADTNWAQKAVEESDYILTLEKELEAAKVRRAEAIKNAIDSGVRVWEGHRFQVRYKDGERFVIDPDMLMAAYPVIYQELRDRAVRDIKVRPSRREVMDELVNMIGQEAAEAAIRTCGFSVRTEPQYIMTTEGEQ
jgi:hypothetical protein